MKQSNGRSTNPTLFTKEFTHQEALPEAAVARALELIRSGRLHRYNTAPGEISDVALLEKEYSEYVGARYCLALSSCGSSIYVALKCVGLQPGDKVLCNAFTLAPVPGAVMNAGAQPVFVEITDDYLTDLKDLEKKADVSGARYLLLSHMRGHVVDMDRISAICKDFGITLVEDCAHTMGCRWGDRFTGRFGTVGCYSSQTYKHVNSGEGGFLVTDDDDVMAQAILFSGSYMFYDCHISRPPLEVFEKYKDIIPNLSLRMSNLTAALIRPQLANLEVQCQRWNERYHLLERELSGTPHISIPRRSPRERYVGSSMQFTLTGVGVNAAEEFVQTCKKRGVVISWYGAKDPIAYTSSWESWRYFENMPTLSNTRKVLDFLCDFRIPLTFSLDDCRAVAAVIREVSMETFSDKDREDQVGEYATRNLSDLV